MNSKNALYHMVLLKLIQQHKIRIYNLKVYFQDFYRIYYLFKILYPIFDYPHEHYTFKHFEV